MAARKASPATDHRIHNRASVDPEWVLVPLRAFLGVTFCFAGLQKLANPNFFRAASPISIQAQLKAAEHTSPIHSVLAHLVKIGGLLGVVIALAEVAIGLGVLAGVLTRIAAVGGMFLSFGLFLTVSFHSRPYYTGADIGYVFAFTPLLLAGAGERFTLPAALERYLQRNPWHIYELEFDEQRRNLIVSGAVGAFGLVLAGFDAGLGRLLGRAKPPASGTHLSTQTPGRKGSTTTSTAPVQSQPSVPTATPPGSRIGSAADVPVGSAASFQDPSSGDPAIVIQPRAGQFVAFDAVCPHAGCTVEYAQSQSVIVCPCHGSLFNAATGAVEQGPAASDLRPITINQGPNGQLYAV